MARPKAKAPARRYHISGQSVVTIAGKDYYLGPHDSPLAIARYAVLIATYQAGGLILPPDFELASLDDRVAALLGQESAAVAQQADAPVLVRHVTAAYREHAKLRYATSLAEIHRLSQLCDEIDLHDGDLPAAQYGPLRLQQQRQRWIDAGKARVYCNRLTNCVKRIWRHAVSQELVDGEGWERLRSVEALRAGQTTAPEKDPILPVDIEVVRATAKHLSPIVKAMIRIQIATGMRPSEICRMRPMDIDRSGEVWVYRPAKHKTAHRGRAKAVPLIGDARDAITDYLQRDPKAFCFSPRESVAWLRATQRANRKSKVQPSQANRAKPDPKKQPGDQYTHHSYRRAIQSAAKQAKVQRWHPYQLRHLAATTIRAALGIEAAQAALGHAHPNMTQHYAQQDLEKAIEAAKVAPKL